MGKGKRWEKGKAILGGEGEGLRKKKKESSKKFTCNKENSSRPRGRNERRNSI